MQLGYASYFVQRMKFYPLHKFNVMVEKGEFDYEGLPKLYAIAFLEKNILPTVNFHTISNLRSEQGELIDSQMTFITVELSKFNKQVIDIQSDVEKLVYTMKTLHRTTEISQYPAFWNEDWLRRAIDELDTRKMTPEERAYFARVTAANAEAVKAEKKRIEDARLQDKTETAIKLLSLGVLTSKQIAESTGLSEDQINKLSADK